MFYGRKVRVGSSSSPNLNLAEIVLDILTSGLKYYPGLYPRFIRNPNLSRLFTCHVLPSPSTACHLNSKTLNDKKIISKPTIISAGAIEMVTFAPPNHREYLSPSDYEQKRIIHDG